MIAGVVAAVRAARPLVHCIGPTVSQAIVADGLLAAGARPMMTETAAEAPTIVTHANALLINLGMLSVDGLAGIPPTVDAARVPWVLDPAAVGPTPLRRKLAASLLAKRPAVIRANASEVLVLARGAAGGSGPDATDRVLDADDAALALARTTGAVVAISGEVDRIVTPDGRRAETRNGSRLLPLVVGTGCLLGALTAACLTEAEPADAALAATSWLNVAAERAAQGDPGPGTFRVRLIDDLHTLTAAEIETTARTTWI